MENINENLKIKAIAFLSSIFLWMYVMAVVDPEETKLIENIPVRITNTEKLQEKGLIIYPEEDIEVDVYVTGNLSNIQKVNKNDIKVEGEILNPIEGKNEIYLTASTSQKVTCEFKDSIVVIGLDKIVEESKNLEIDIIGDENKLENISINKDTIKVSGPRTLVSQVEKVTGTIDLKDEQESLTKAINIIPVDAKGKKVEGLILEQNSIEVGVTLLSEKEVPIKLNIENDIDEVNEVEYKLEMDKILIKGNSELIEGITSIDTETLKLSDIINNQLKEIKLIIPEGVKSEIGQVGITKINTIIEKNFVFTKDEIEIRNNIENIDIEIPEEINVKVEYNESNGNLEKNNIVLFVDLQKVNEENKIVIEYGANIELLNISISPDSIKILETNN